MASGARHTTQHVKSKGKGLALVVEATIESITEPRVPDSCVICLDYIPEKATALPCQHDQFHFQCLGTWLQQSQICPLCKTEVRAIKYETESKENGSKIFHLPAPEAPRRRPVHEDRWHRARAQGFHPYERQTRPNNHRNDWGTRPSGLPKEDAPLEFRKRVYREKMYSAYVGANRISRYQNVTPASFLESSGLVNRAKTFIRRELQVFDFLNNSGTAESSSSSALSSTRAHRRSSNAEFLLEYIVGILKSIDLKGSTGQAEELLKDFLGRENAKLFLHELEAWLRSPYERLHDWDRHVQYGNVIDVRQSNRR